MQATWVINLRNLQWSDEKFFLLGRERERERQGSHFSHIIDVCTQIVGVETVREDEVEEGGSEQWRRRRGRGIKGCQKTGWQTILCAFIYFFLCWPPSFLEHIPPEHFKLKKFFISVSLFSETSWVFINILSLWQYNINKAKTKYTLQRTTIIKSLPLHRYAIKYVCPPNFPRIALTPNLFRWWQK